MWPARRPVCLADESVRSMLQFPSRIAGGVHVSEFLEFERPPHELWHSECPCQEIEDFAKHGVGRRRRTEHEHLGVPGAMRRL